MIIPSQDHMRLSVTPSADGSVDFVRILGDVDLSSSIELDLAAGRLIESPSRVVYVDLAGTTFMGSTLISFLVRVGAEGRDDRSLVLCRPTPAARRVIHMTLLDELAEVRPDLPHPWPDNTVEADPATHPMERSTSS
jgi:anti-anti-sigma factor